jgi:hypothetical protein
MVRWLATEGEEMQANEGLREDAVRLPCEAYERQGREQGTTWVQTKHPLKKSERFLSGP